MTEFRIAVCIPTFRRPDQLRALVDALCQQDLHEPFAVVIGNNDTEPVLGRLQTRLPLAGVYKEIFVTARGVAAVRNGMFEFALAAWPALEWIACLDDDQVPDPDWLRELLGAGRRSRAVLVGGPVQKIPETRTFLSLSLSLKDYLPTTESFVNILNETGNLLISAKYLRSFDGPAFDVAFGTSGGEDYEFFVRARKHHAPMYWAPLSKVSEVIPVSRLRFRPVVVRVFASSCAQARADLKHGTRLMHAKKVGRDTLALPFVITRNVYRYRRPMLAASVAVHRLVTLAGRIAGSFGVTINNYGADR